MGYPVQRLRRLRRSEGLRRLVRETHVCVDDLIAPIFLCDGESQRQEIDAMPGVFRFSVDTAVEEAKALHRLRIPAMLLFGVPPDGRKDKIGKDAWAADGLVQQAFRAIKKAVPGMVLIADTCFCEYTDHGHCGVLNAAQEVMNDRTLPNLGKTAVSQARAGADIIAPSAMMDGQVAAIRKALDAEGFEDTAIMSYAAKYSSAFYGPFREAAHSTPAFGNRRQYQMDCHNAREAVHEVRLDVEEGADIIMVKPGIAYLDIVRAVREAVPNPVAAYSVSGEYAMIKAAARNGWLDEKATALEMVTALKRAGADMIITYWAKDLAKWLEPESVGGSGMSGRKPAGKAGRRKSPKTGRKRSSGRRK